MVKGLYFQLDETWGAGQLLYFYDNFFDVPIYRFFDDNIALSIDVR